MISLDSNLGSIILAPGGFSGGSDSKESSVLETQIPSLGREDPLEKGICYPLQFFLPRKFHRQRSLVGLQKVGHDCVTNTDAILESELLGGCVAAHVRSRAIRASENHSAADNQGKDELVFPVSGLLVSGPVSTLNNHCGDHRGFYAVDCIYWYLPY